MKKSLFIFFAALLFMLSAASRSVAQPASLSAIPVPPSSVAVEGVDLGALAYFSQGEQFSGLYIQDKISKPYGTDASLEETLNFFLKNLGGKKAEGQKMDDPVDLAKLKQGEKSEILYNSSERGILFWWYVRKENGDLNRLSIVVTDGNMVKNLKQKKVIVFFEESYSLFPKVIPPTDKDLRVPFYPGAVFDPAQSFSLGESFYTYFFLSTDEAEKVAAFYSKAFNKEPQTGTSGYGTKSYNFQQILKDFPEDFLAVLTDPKEKKTVIMIVRTGK